MKSSSLILRYVSIAALFSLLLPFNNCGSKFSSGGKAISLDSSSLSPSSTSNQNSLPSNPAQIIASGAQLYATNCAACHSALDSSTKKGRAATQISAAITSVPVMTGLKSLTSTQISLIAEALNTGTTTINAREAYVCNSAAVPTTSSLKLTNREFKGSLFALMDDFATTLKSDSSLISLINAIPSDTQLEVNYNREQFFLLTSTMLSSYFEASFKASSLIAANATGLQNYPNTNKCLASTAITQACHQSFVKEFAGRAFRRPLSASELSYLSTQFYDSSLSKTDLIQFTITGILQSPDFLYRIYDQGVTSSKGSNVLSLSAHEFASKMAYLLTGLPPDATLRSLADSGQILDASVAGLQIDRLLATSNASTMWTRFFRESLGYDYFSSFNYPTTFLEGQSTSGLQDAMISEADNFFIDIVQKQSGSYKDLMTSTRSTVNNAALAQLYGVTNSTSVVNLPAQRTGFLTRAAFLAKRSGTITSPVKRGQEVLEAVLCGLVGAPPPGVSATLDPVPSGTYQTTRQRYASKTEVSGTTCVSCHSRMNNLGYPFEMFDTLGRFRAQEKVYDTASGNLATTLALDTRSTTNELSSNANNITDAVDLATQLSNNDKAMMCFVKKFKQFESRRAALSSDNCQMNKALSTMYGDNSTQGSIQNAIKQYILSDDFKIWSY